MNSVVKYVARAESFTRIYNRAILGSVVAVCFVGGYLSAKPTDQEVIVGDPKQIIATKNGGWTTADGSLRSPKK